MKKLNALLIALIIIILPSISFGQNDTIKGLLLYDNVTQERIDGATVYLKNASYNVIATTTTTTGSSVNFEFPGLSSGTYYVGVSVISDAWKGCNSIDAMMIQQHYSGIITLTGLPLIAADVIDLGVINTSDALEVQKRFVGMPFTFDSEDWILNIDCQVVITSGNEFKAVYTRCYGDVN